MNAIPNLQHHAGLAEAIGSTRRTTPLTVAKPAATQAATGIARHARVAVLGIAAIATVLFVLRDELGSQSAPQISEAAPPRHAASGADRAAPVATARTAPGRAAPAIHLLRPRVQPTEADDAEEAMFASHNWSPPPPPPVVVKQAPPPKPTAPALPFTYLGKMLDAGKWEAYLSRGEETFVVREHSAIDANYRAETILPPVLTITYLPLKQTQTMSIGEGE